MISAFNAGVWASDPPASRVPDVDAPPLLAQSPPAAATLWPDPATPCAKPPAPLMVKAAAVGVPTLDPPLNTVLSLSLRARRSPSRRTRSCQLCTSPVKLSATVVLRWPRRVGVVSRCRSRLNDRCWPSAVPAVLEDAPVPLRCLALMWANDSSRTTLVGAPDVGVEPHGRRRTRDCDDWRSVERDTTNESTLACAHATHVHATRTYAVAGQPDGRR